MNGRETAGVSAISLAIIAALAVWAISFSTRAPFGSTSESTSVTGIVQAPVPDTSALTLHSVPYMEALVNKTFLLPSPSAVDVGGSSLKLLGVVLDNPAPDWMVTIYYTNQTFINGSTTVAEILNNAGWIAIVESPASAGANDASVVNQATSSVTICQSPAGSSQCTSTYTETKNVQVTTQNGVGIIVNSFTPELYWLDNQKLLYIDLVGGTGASISQLLDISDLMTK